MPATIRDIRKMTGLSLATISKYLNGGNVLPENRVKIQKAIDELHFEVNETARSLVTRRTKMIGVVVYDVSSMFVGTIVRYIGEAFREKGYGILICDSANDCKIEKEHVSFLVGKKVDGIIILPVDVSSRFLKPAVQAKVPVVLLDRDVGDDQFDSVTITNRKAAEEAVGYLLEHHHKKIAIIGSKKELTGIERVEGYKKAMSQAGIPLVGEYIKLDCHCIPFGYDAMAELLKMDNPPTAVLMTNYELSLGAVMALQDSGKRTPDDISMIGFDDLILSELTKPKLTIVIQPMKELAYNAAEILLMRIESPEKDSGVIQKKLFTRIKEGESVGTLSDE